MLVDEYVKFSPGICNNVTEFLVYIGTPVANFFEYRLQNDYVAENVFLENVDLFDKNSNLRIRFSF